jgi:hypothetical protein
MAQALLILSALADHLFFTGARTLRQSHSRISCPWLRNAAHPIHQFTFECRWRNGAGTANLGAKTGSLSLSSDEACHRRVPVFREAPVVMANRSIRYSPVLELVIS